MLCCGLRHDIINEQMLIVFLLQNVLENTKKCDTFPYLEYAHLSKMNILILFLVISGFVVFLAAVQALGFLYHWICAGQIKNKTNTLLPAFLRYRNFCSFRRTVRDMYKGKKAWKLIAFRYIFLQLCVAVASRMALQVGTSSENNYSSLPNSFGWEIWT